MRLRLKFENILYKVFKEELFPKLVFFELQIHIGIQFSPSFYYSLDVAFYELMCTQLWREVECELPDYKLGKKVQVDSMKDKSSNIDPYSSIALSSNIICFVALFDWISLV